MEECTRRPVRLFSLSQPTFSSLESRVRGLSIPRNVLSFSTTGRRGMAESFRTVTASRSVVSASMTGTLSSAMSLRRTWISLRESGGFTPNRLKSHAARSGSIPGQTAVICFTPCLRRSSARAYAEAMLSISGLRCPLTKIRGSLFITQNPPFVSRNISYRKQKAKKGKRYFPDTRKTFSCEKLFSCRNGTTYRTGIPLISPGRSRRTLRLVAE